MPMSRSIVKSVARSLVSSVVSSLSGGGSGSPPLPTDGLIGAWYADEFQATPRKAIPNAIATEPLSQNLLRAPVRLFNNNDYYFKNGATVVDGLNESEVSLGSGDHFVFYAADGTNPSLPAGEYTMAITVRRNAGSDQSFRMTFLHADVSSGTLTATATDQRFTLTATVGTGAQGLLFVRTVDNSTPAELIISDVALYAGDTDLGEPVLAGHLYLGDTQYDTRPTCADGILDLTATGAYGIMQWPASLALDEFTLVAVASKTANPTYSAAICVPNAQNTMAAAFDLQEQANSTFGTSGNSYQDIAIAAPEGYNPLDAGWRFIGHRHTGTVASLYANNVRLLRKTGLSPSTPVAASHFIVGAFSSNTLTGGYEINAMALYDRALSDDEMLDAYAALAARAGASSLTLTTASRYYVALGDSLTADSTTPSYAHLFAENADPKAYGAVYAQSGGTLANLVANATVIDGVLPADKAGAEFVLTVLIGTNDLTDSGDVAAFIADYEAFLIARRAAGWDYIVVGTLPPNDRPNFNTRRNLANPYIRAWEGTVADAIFDIAANTTIGEDGDEANATYYSDGVHFTLAGQEIVEGLFRAAVNGLS